jgi:hypothetical protein
MLRLNLLLHLMLRCLQLSAKLSLLLEQSLIDHILLLQFPDLLKLLFSLLQSCPVLILQLLCKLPLLLIELQS